MTSFVPTRTARSSIPPKGTPLGPLRRRSRITLVAQYTLQVVYIPAAYLVAAALFVLLLVGGGISAGPVERPRKGKEFDNAGGLAWMPWWRLRLEASGTPEEWRRHAGRALDALIAEADGAEPGPRTWSDGDITIAVRDYRLIGAEGVEDLARARGWRLSWGFTANPRRRLALVRVQDGPAGQVQNAARDRS